MVLRTPPLGSTEPSEPPRTGARGSASSFDSQGPTRSPRARIAPACVVVVRRASRLALRITAPAVEELHPIGLHADLGALLAGALVFPGVHLERALDVDPAPFPETLAAVLRLAIPDGHINEKLFLAALALARHPRSAGDQTQLGSPPFRRECGATQGRTSGCPSRRLCSSRPWPILLGMNSSPTNSGT